MSAADVAATRAVLDELAQRQDELGARLAVSGLVSFADRSEWLRSHRSADEVLAEVRLWGRLFRRHGVRLVRERFVRPRSLAVPKVQHRRPVQVITPDRALALALGAVPVEREVMW